MKPKKVELPDFETKLFKGLKLVSKKLIKEAKEKNQELVVFRNGKIRRIKY